MYALRDVFYVGDSITRRLSSPLQVMKRLRVGIGRPTGKTSVDRYVLGRFSSDEKKLLDSVLIQSVDLLLSLLSEQRSQPALQSPSSPAGGRHAAQKTKERARSVSPAEDSAAAQSWSFQTLLVKQEHFDEALFIL